MNIGSLLLGFVFVALMAGMVLYAGATESTEVVDSQGAVPGAVANSTNQIVNDVTVAGSTTLGYFVLILAALGIIGAVGMVVIYSRT